MFDGNGKAIAMGRGLRWSFRTVVAGLLMLATLLVYAVPGRASLTPHHPVAHAHEHAVHDHGPVDHGPADHGLADAHDAAAVHDHERAPCGDAGLLDDGNCCSVAQCTTMHGGLPAGVLAAFVPRLDRVNLLPALATPEGIGRDPALRPPL